MRSFTRKDLIQLLIAVAIGYGISQWLLRSVPIGRDVGASHAAQAMVRDTESPSSPVDGSTLTLVVFTDYQCPVCKLANPEMDAAVAKDGRARVVYRDWPVFGPLSERAARVAIASHRQGIYPAVHRRLMDERRRLEDPVLREAVEASGGDWQVLQDDLRTHAAEIDRQLARNRMDAYALGLPGTPGYLAGTRLVSGALDASGFAKLFAEARDR